MGKYFGWICFCSYLSVYSRIFLAIHCILCVDRVKKDSFYSEKLAFSWILATYVMTIKGEIYVMTIKGEIVWQRK